MRGALARALLGVASMRDNETIDPRELNVVVGGMRQWAKSPDNSALVTGLQTLSTSLDSLKSQQNTSSSSAMWMLPLVFAMRNRG
jgi:hypothetical protein